MPTITTIKQHRYAGKLRKPGDTYDARGNQDARLIEAMGWGIKAMQMPEPVVQVPVMTYRTRAMTAEQPAEPERAKRKYTRRNKAADTESPEATPEDDQPQADQPGDSLGD